MSGCPSCGQAPAARTIWPADQGGHFGTCADRFHDYPWLDTEREEHDPECACPDCCDRRAGGAQIGPCGDDA